MEATHDRLAAQVDGPHLYIVLICSIATIGGFLFGFDSGVINGTVEGLQQSFNSTSAGTGFNVASMLLGCAAGAFSAGRIADFWGRKPVLLVTAACFLVSAWGSGIATSSMEFVSYRILGGLAVGAASVLSPAYISEVAPARWRGRLATIQQIAIISGLFAAFVSNYLLAKTAGSATAEWFLGFDAWRWMFWVEMVPATLFLLALLWIPESPRYLALSGQLQRARNVLERLGSDPGEIAVKLTELESTTVSEHRPRLRDLLDRAGKIRRIVWVGLGLAVLQQLVGINVVFYYGAVLWQSVGFSESDALMINIISGGISIAACLITIGLIDKIGRKPLLLAGSIGMAASLALVSLSFSTAQLDASGRLLLSDTMGLVALISANTYVFFFNASWGPVMWVMLGEMFPNRMRGSGLAVAGLAQWGANFLITMSFPLMLHAIGLAAAYGIYMLFACLSVLFVVRMVHETNGRELEHMHG